jgi:phospholipid/cholesterol/gamma-HCH transport system substrate-binding protein
MADYKRGRELGRIGGLTALATTVFLALFGFATDRSVSQHRMTIYARFPAADGLSWGDAVLLHGVKVGDVRGITFATAGSHDGVVVKLRLKQRVSLTADASAALVAADIFGKQLVTLQPGSGAIRALEEGDTLPGARPGSLTGRMDELGQSAQRLIGETTLDLLHGTLAGVSGAAENVGVLAGSADELLRRQQQVLGTLTKEASGVAANLRAITDPAEAARIRAGLEQSLAELAQLIARSDTTAMQLAQVAAKLNHGEGSAALLLNDPALYQRTVGAMTSLEALLTDLRANPKRYINVSVF